MTLRLQRQAHRVSNIGTSLIDAGLDRPPGIWPAGQPEVGVEAFNGLQRLTDEVIVVELQQLLRWNQSTAALKRCQQLSTGRDRFLHLGAWIGNGLQPGESANVNHCRS